MLKLAAFLLLLITQVLTSSITPGHAEVRLYHNSLSVNINDTTMKEVLDDIGQQGNLNIVAFEETQIGNVRISKKFWNLPLEAGLDRLLSNWNYGISRDRLTGAITTLYLVSRRIDSSTSNGPPATSTLYPSDQNTSQSQSHSTVLSQTYGANVLEPTDGEELDEEDDLFNDEELETLPPNLIETLERWQRNGNG